MAKDGGYRVEADLTGQEMDTLGKALAFYKLDAKEAGLLEEADIAENLEYTLTVLAISGRP